MSASSPIGASTDRLLTRVARRLRFWSLAEGSATAIAILAILFWLSLGLDYAGDVWLDASISVRAVVSALWLLAVLGVVGYWVVRRMGGRPAQSSLALLVERRRGDLADRLLTAVELSSRPHPYSKSLVEDAVRQAESSLADFQVSSLFNRGRVGRLCLLAALLAAAVVAAIVSYPHVTLTWARRVVCLENVLYPRKTRLNVVNISYPSQKVARGRDVDLLIDADDSGVIPDRVSIRLWMPHSGGSTRIFMTKVGRNRYRHTLRNVFESVVFQASGGDARTPRYRLETVEPPAVDFAEVEVAPPSYTDREPFRKEVAGSPIPVPASSKVRVTIRSNKQIASSTATVGMNSLPVQRTGPATFAIDLNVSENSPIRIGLVDLDGISLDEPFPIDLVSVADETPKVSAEAKGVSTAVTRVANVPLDIKASDDYGLRSIQIESVVDSTPPARKEVPLPSAAPTNVENRVLFDVAPIGVQPGARLSLAVLATDGDTLRGPHVGRSETILFEVVTPEELLSRLTTRELELRQRFEQVTAELRESRETLAGVRRKLDDPADQAQTARRLNTDRILGTTRKDAGETEAIASQFREIVDELVNSRVGNATLLERLKSGVIDPLGILVGSRFPETSSELERLARAEERTEIEQSLDAAHASLDILIADCEAILKAMMKLESFNEVVSMLRSIMEEQERIIDETKKVRKEKILDLLKE